MEVVFKSLEACDSDLFNSVRSRDCNRAMKAYDMLFLSTSIWHLSKCLYHAEDIGILQFRI